MFHKITTRMGNLIIAVCFGMSLSLLIPTIVEVELTPTPDPVVVDYRHNYRIQQAYADLSLAYLRSGTGVPVVSSISSNVKDVDSSKPGIQIYPGTSLTLSATAIDKDLLTWVWIQKFGNEEIVDSSGTGKINNVNYTYNYPGLYTWYIRVTDGVDAREHQLSIEVVPVPRSFSLKTTVEGKGSIVCDYSTCPNVIEEDKNVTFIAIPDPEYIFTGWKTGNSLSACKDIGSCSFTIKNDTALTAVFALKATPDITSPVISNSVIRKLDNNTVIISWITDELATAEVEEIQTGSNQHLKYYDVNKSLSSIHSVEVKDLMRGQNYNFKLRSVDAAGNIVNSDLIPFTAPLKPESILPLDAQSGSVVLSWSNPTDTDYSQIIIYRGSTALSTPTGTPLAVVDGTTTTSYKDSDVEPSTRYVYTIFTKDIDGVYSDPQSITFTTAEAPKAAAVIKSSSGGGSGGGGGGGGSQNPVVTNPLQLLPCTSGSSNGKVFGRTLNLGSKGDDVKALQVFLNKNGFIIAASGNGSPGKESTYFGEATQAAVIRFQNKYASEILGSTIAKATGIVGTATLRKLNSLVSPTGTTNQLIPCIPTTGSNTTPTSTTNPGTTITSSGSFTRNLTIGSRGEDVRRLQIFLNSKGYKVATSGNGSPGKESTYFGVATKAALAKFQAANGITPASGYFGVKSRAVIR